MYRSLSSTRHSTSCSDPDAYAKSSLAKSATALPRNLYNVKSMPIGLTPGFLSNAISRNENKALNSRQEMISFAIKLSIGEAKSLNLELLRPNLINASN